MSEQLSRDAFAEQLNTVFYIHFTPEKIVEAKLVSVTELKKRSIQESFSIVFLTQIEELHEQGLYKIEHDKSGSFELFIVPIQKDVEGIKYEAVFNRLAD